MIDFLCPKCGGRVSAVNRLAGKTRTCPACRAEVTVPPESTVATDPDAGPTRAKTPHTPRTEEPQAPFPTYGRNVRSLYCPFCRVVTNHKRSVDTFFKPQVFLLFPLTGLSSAVFAIPAILLGASKTIVIVGVVAFGLMGNYCFSKVLGIGDCVWRCTRCNKTYEEL